MKRALLIALLPLIAASIAAPAYAQGVPGGGCVDENGYAVNCDDEVVIVPDENTDAGTDVSPGPGIVQQVGSLNGTVTIPEVPLVTPTAEVPVASATVVPAATPAPDAAPVAAASSGTSGSTTLPDTSGVSPLVPAGALVLAGLALACGRSLILGSSRPD